MNIRSLLAGLLALSLLLGGCAAEVSKTDAPAAPAGAQDDAAAPEPASPDAQPDAAAYAMPYSASDGWDPYSCRSSENRALFSLLYEGLFEVTPEFDFSGVLCSDYRVSDDEKTWTFTVDPGARFSDGTPLSAASVVAAYDAARASDLYKSRFSHILSYEATDTRTLTVTLDAAHGSLPLLLDIPVVKTSAGRAVGSGPYVLRGQTLTASAGWWAVGDPPLGGADIALVAAESESDVRDAFELRQITLVSTDPTAGSACVYHSDYELWTSPTSVMVYLGFNRSGVFSDAALRAAVTQLVDRERIVTEDFSGFAVPASLPASPIAAQYDRGLAAQYAYDPGAFSASVPDEEITLLVSSGDPCRVAAAKRIAQEMERAGFTVAVSPLAPADYQSALENGAYDCYLGQIRLTADFDLAAFFSPTGAAAYGIGGAEAALVRNAKMLENAGNAYDLHKLVMDDGLLCPVLFKSGAIYTVRGLVPDGLTAAPYNLFYRAAQVPDEPESPAEPE